MADYNFDEPIMNFDLNIDNTALEEDDNEAVKEEMKMTYSAIVTGQDGKKMVRVQFDRVKDGVPGTAEGVLPEGKIVKQDGFAKEEVLALEIYLSQNADEIMKKAKVISNPMHWF